jgi:hypothetical protein
MGTWYGSLCCLLQCNVFCAMQVLEIGSGHVLLLLRLARSALPRSVGHVLPLGQLELDFCDLMVCGF